MNRTDSDHQQQAAAQGSPGELWAWYPAIRALAPAAAHNGVPLAPPPEFRPPAVRPEPSIDDLPSDVEAK